MLSNVLHCFSKHRIIHQFEKVLFEFIFRFGSQFGVEIDVGLQPSALIEFDCAMNFIQNQSVLDSLIQSFDVNDKFAFYRKDLELAFPLC